MLYREKKVQNALKTEFDIDVPAVIGSFKRPRLK